MFDPLDWIPNELRRLENETLARTRRVVAPLAGGWCVVSGRRLRNFASNDYLDLARDPRVVAAAELALRDCGAGAGASALVCGRTPWHEALEERLARFENQPSAVLFPTGSAANCGTICALVGPGDDVYSDRLNHASLIDGCRLSGARVHVFPHRDLGELERTLKHGDGNGRKLIVVDSVFSMDGDLAPLADLCDIADRCGAMLLVDEAHATGVFGDRGRGVCEIAGVESRVVVRVGTLSKALGSMGGFVAGPRPLTDWLWNRARTQIYSTALPPSACAAAAAAVDLVEQEPDRRMRLLRTAELLRDLLAAAGVEIVCDSTGPIIPIVLNAADRAVRIAARLEHSGFLVGAIRPPSVPAGTSRLRISVSAAHTADDAARLAGALAEALRSD